MDGLNPAPSLRTLVFEPSPVALSGLRMMLVPPTWDATLCDRIAPFWAESARDDWDAVLLDVTPPEVLHTIQQGRELVRPDDVAARLAPLRERGIACIAMTASLAGDVPAPLPTAVDAILEKPFAADELERLLRGGTGGPERRAAAERDEVPKAAQ